jgi:hypothetical protein
MKIWQCALCGHIVLADKRPVLRWDDGHSCIFYEQPDVVKVFREINNAFYDGDHPIDGISTALTTNEKFCTLIIYEDGQTLAAVTETPTGRVKILFPDGTSVTLTLADKGEIISRIKKRSKRLSGIQA